MFLTVYPILPRRQVDLLLSDGVRLMGVENKKAVTTDPGEEPLTGPESCVTAFLLALHFQQCSHCITQCQAVQYLSCVVGCWCGFGSHGFTILPNGADIALHPACTFVCRSCTPTRLEIRDDNLNFPIQASKSPCVLMQTLKKGGWNLSPTPNQQKKNMNRNCSRHHDLNNNS